MLCAVRLVRPAERGPSRGWRKALAEAAHTTPEHVAVHCVHPHNAPFADVEAQKLIDAAKGPPSRST